MGEKVQGIRNMVGRHKIVRGGKNSTGNGEDKELIYMGCIYSMGYIYNP